jgi:hypothetical protein
MFLCTIENGRRVLPDSRRERLGSAECVAPVVVKAWMPVVAGMIEVVSFRTTALMPPYTVCGHACPIRGGGCRGGSPRGFQPRGSSAPTLTSQGSSEAEIVSDGPGAPDA